MLNPQSVAVTQLKQLDDFLHLHGPSDSQSHKIRIMSEVRHSFCSRMGMLLLYNLICVLALSFLWHVINCAALFYKSIEHRTWLKSIDDQKWNRIGELDGNHWCCEILSAHDISISLPPALTSLSGRIWINLYRKRKNTMAIDSCCASQRRLMKSFHGHVCVRFWNWLQFVDGGLT